MARYSMLFGTPFNPQQVQDFFVSYMKKEGFEYYTKKGENCWKKGMGLMTAPQYIKLTPYDNNGTYVLEAWLKFALLPGVYVGEMGIKGFLGAIPKSFLKTRVDQILAGLQACPPKPQNFQQTPPQN